ncbi:MAG: PEP-CTERM sorting domain-containing protein [Pirellulales bacterium]|nr:PEP-CTERM sorting domain-containing protein [Pirellulales bacterium]
MNVKLRLVLTMVFLAAIGLALSPAMADPLPGELLKFQQLPMVKTVIGDQVYFGHDEPSTAQIVNPGEPIPIYQGYFMADDFADPFGDPVVHVRWWGSYMNAEPGTDPVMPIKRFLISFETDIPAVIDPASGQVLEPSMPGAPLLSQIVHVDDDGILTPGSGTFLERLISPGGNPLNEGLYEYNAELRCPFEQERDTVYWLKIVALTGPNDDTLWGWHNRDYTIQDPYASPVVVPGERVVGTIPLPDVNGNVPTPIWHFQDDAVTGQIQLGIDPNMPPCDPNAVWVEQFNMRPTSYEDVLDGPSGVAGTDFPGIGHFSKDLAFELYRVPEPSTVTLLIVGLVSLGVFRWRKR